MKKKVLIVDDEPNLGLIVKKMLESTHEYEAMICSKSVEALDLAKRSQPDVILLDINMPGLTGPELAKQLMSSQATKDIPFLYLTAMVVRKEVEEAHHMIGGHYFAAKPVRLPDLLHVIDLVLRNKSGEIAPEAAPEGPPKKPTVNAADLLGHKLRIQENSDGSFQISIPELKAVKMNATFSTLKEAQDAAHSLLHFHVQRVQYCTCGKPLEWKESDE